MLYKRKEAREMGWRAMRDARRSAIVQEKERQEKYLEQGRIWSAFGYKGSFPCDGLPRPSFWKADGGRVWVFDN